MQNSFPEIKSPNPQPRLKHPSAVPQKLPTGSFTTTTQRDSSPDSVLHVLSPDGQEEDFSSSSEYLKDMVLQFHRKQSLSPDATDEPYLYPTYHNLPRRSSTPSGPFDRPVDPAAYHPSNEPIDSPTSPTLPNMRSMPKVCLSPYKEAGGKSPTPRHRIGIPMPPHFTRNGDSPPSSTFHQPRAPRVLNIDSTAILSPSSPPPEAVILPSLAPAITPPPHQPNVLSDRKHQLEVPIVAFPPPSSIKFFLKNIIRTNRLKCVSGWRTSKTPRRLSTMKRRMTSPRHHSTNSETRRSRRSFHTASNRCGCSLHLPSLATGNLSSPHRRIRRVTLTSLTSIYEEARTHPNPSVVEQQPLLPAMYS